MNRAPQLLLLLFAVFWGWIMWRVARYSDPQTGWNILHLTPLFGIAAAYAIWKRHRALAAVSVASILLAVACYHFNVLVPYETWLQRGMPPRPF